MMLTGVIAKQEGPFWSADCDAVGAHTQGRSRKEAAAMLAEVVELMVGREGFAVTVSATGAVGNREYGVLIEANEPALLIAELLEYQREANKLTRAEVAKRLGAVSPDAYAAYEQGKREPTLSVLSELLAAGPRILP